MSAYYILLVYMILKDQNGDEADLDPSTSEVYRIMCQVWCFINPGPLLSSCLEVLEMLSTWKHGLTQIKELLGKRVLTNQSFYTNAWISLIEVLEFSTINRILSINIHKKDIIQFDTILDITKINEKIEAYVSRSSLLA